jgi:hypothetical protein
LQRAFIRRIAKNALEVINDFEGRFAARRDATLRPFVKNPLTHLHEPALISIAPQVLIVLRPGCSGRPLTQYINERRAILR